MLAIALSALAWAVASHAQNTTVSLLIPIGDYQSLVGSIAGSDASATTFVVQCPPGAVTPQGTKRKRQASATASFYDAEATEGARYDDSSDSDNACGFPKPITITQGASTLNLEYSFQEVTNSVDCKLMGTTQAVCVGSVSNAGDSENNSQKTATLAGSEFPAFIPVVITAGASSTGSSSSASSSDSSRSSSMPATSTGSSATSGGAAAQETGGSGGMHVEPALGVGIAGIIAVGFAAVML